MPDLGDLMRRVEELEKFRERVSNGMFIRIDLFDVHMTRIENKIKDVEDSFGAIKGLLIGTIATIVVGVITLLIGKVL